MESVSMELEEWSLYPGEIVYASECHPDGLTIQEYLALPKSARRHCDFRPMVRGKDVRVGRLAQMAMHA